MHVCSLILIAWALAASAALGQPRAGAAEGTPAGSTASKPVAAGTEHTVPLARRAGSLGVRPDPDIKDQVVVREVGPGTTAAAAGIRVGDTLISVAGHPIAGVDTLRATMRALRAGQRVDIEVRRQRDRVLLPIALGEPRERVEGSVLSYRSVDSPRGYRLRSIVTVPERASGAGATRHPAFLFVQGITCDSIDRPDRPDAADTRLVHAMARQGFVTLRVDKPGMGDSEGPPCNRIGFAEELDGYLAALAALAAMPEVDPRRIYVFGYSMGGVMAPFLARDNRVRGTIVFGTLARTWFEYQLENTRRQSSLSGLSPGEVSEQVLRQARESSMILIDKKTLGDVWRRWPEQREPTQGLEHDENHIATRGMGFFHDLQELNLARAWQESSGAVLALHGEYDWVASEQDHRLIADIVNARTPGAGSSITLPRVDHGFTRHASLQDSVQALGRGEWAEDLPTTVMQWIRSVEAAAS